MKLKAPSWWRGGRTPFGTTNSYEKYSRDWKRFNSKLEKMTGLTVYGFDPGISMYEIKDGKCVEGSSVQFPLWFAKILVDKVENLEEKIEDLKNELCEDE